MTSHLDRSRIHEALGEFIEHGPKGTPDEVYGPLERVIDDLLPLLEAVRDESEGPKCKACEGLRRMARRLET